MKSVCYKTPEQKNRQNIHFPRAHDVDERAR